MKHKDINVLMVASENDALPGCKVGGIADVIRDLPAALLKRGCGVSVVIPSYGFLMNEIKCSKLFDEIEFLFSDITYKVLYYRVKDSSGVVNYIVDCPDFYKRFNPGSEKRIYCDDGADAPFATDATRFAFFSRAVAEGIKKKTFGAFTILHLHDWHTAFLLILREFHQSYKALKKYRTVLTIHNLAVQGIRPFQGHSSSLREWYPDLFKFDRESLEDKRWPDCMNPMAAGIRLADAVNTVSPTYAKEILKPGDPPFYYGGDGLEKDLLKVKRSGKLFGILNGCANGGRQPVPVYHFTLLLSYFKNVVQAWASSDEFLRSSHYLTLEKLSSIRAEACKDPVILTSIGRMVEQKYYLLRARGRDNFSAISGILEGIKGRGIYVVLGTGDRDYENFLNGISLKYENFIFLNGYSKECAEMLYANGHLFLMPSSYEPCGIGQMLAMREGQPCVAHGVGGLKDTVQDNINGFIFNGDTVEEQVDNFVDKCLAAVEIRYHEVSKWDKICSSAKRSEFSWDKSATEYIKKLYR